MYPASLSRSLHICQNFWSRARHARLDKLTVGGAAEGGTCPVKGKKNISPIVSFGDESSKRTHGHLREQKIKGHWPVREERNTAVVDLSLLY